MNNKHTVKNFIPRLVLSIMLIVTATILLTGCESRQQRQRYPERFHGLYTDGKMLFVLERNRLCQYDISEKTGVVLLKGDFRTSYSGEGFIRTLYVDNEYIIYFDGKSLKTLERSTGITETVPEFEKIIGTDTGVSKIVRKGGEIYFFDDIWDNMYRYDMNNKTLYPIQTCYYSPEDEGDVRILDIHVIDEYIYFMTDAGVVLRMNGDGSGKERIYEIDGGFQNIIWKEDGFDCFLYKNYGDVIGIGYYIFVSFDKNSNVLFRGNLDEMFPEEMEDAHFDVSELIFRSAYDSESDRYVFMNYDEVKSAVLRENACISTIAVLESTYSNKKYTVMPINGHIFVSTRDAVYGEGYSIFDISPSGEVSTFITVDD